jgi:hypothetical protein
MSSFSKFSFLSIIPKMKIKIDINFETLNYLIEMTIDKFEDVKKF